MHHHIFLLFYKIHLHSVCENRVVYNTMALSIPNNLARAIVNHYSKVMDSINIVRSSDIRLINAVRLGRQEVAKLEKIIRKNDADKHNDKHGNS